MYIIIYVHYAPLFDGINCELREMVFWRIFHPSWSPSLSRHQSNVTPRRPKPVPKPSCRRQGLSNFATAKAQSEDENVVSCLLSAANLKQNLVHVRKALKFQVPYWSLKKKIQDLRWSKSFNFMCIAKARRRKNPGPCLHPIWWTGTRLRPRCPAPPWRTKASADNRLRYLTDDQLIYGSHRLFCVHLEVTWSQKILALSSKRKLKEIEQHLVFRIVPISWLQITFSKWCQAWHGDQATLSCPEQ